MDIVEFLTARENEREQEAREAGPSWQRKPACAADDPGVMVFDDDHSYPLIVNPAWVLADVAAKRAIIAEHSPTAARRYDARRISPEHRFTHPDEGWYKVTECPVCADWENFDIYITEATPHVLAPCPTMRALLMLHADHPDFDPAWRAEPATT